ncbi:MAG: pseudouridine synthase [Bdellovibrionota bacterium]
MSSSATPGIRVQKIIADAGMASRREAEKWIEMGDITINGKVASLGDKALPGKDHIKVRGKLMHFNQKRVVIALFKPRDLLSHKINDVNEERQVDSGTIFELLVGVKERVFPVGQLDKDAEGLLLLTNDGELAQRLNQERYEIPKVYKVKIDGHLDESRLKRLQGGRFKVEEKLLKLLDIRPLKELEGKQWIRVKITNTQNRIIRKMFEAVGRPVDKVRRMSFAGVSINGLNRGEFRYLLPDEIAALYEVVGLGINSNKTGEEA